MLNFFKKTIKKIVGSKQDRDMSTYGPMVDQINARYETLQALSNDELRNKTLEFKQRIADYLSEIDQVIMETTERANSLDDFAEKETLFDEVDNLQKERDKHLEEVLLELLPEAFAVVKETARRFTENERLKVTATEHDREIAGSKNHVLIDGDTAYWKNEWIAAGGEVKWGMVHYDVQLIGGMVLHDGKIAEMATGEGKTLVATLPAYLNALAGQGVHIVTVNDYLAKRDSEWVGPIYEFLLLTVDCINNYKPHSEGRKKAYDSDITFGTNNEFGFDYLRDNMVVSPNELVQRKHHYAIIDEVDSVLIDDARTPLIISGPIEQDEEEQEYVALKPTVEKLIQEQRKIVNKYLNEAKKEFEQGNVGVNEGEAGLALLRAHRGLPKYRPLIKFLSQEGVKVELQKTENFYMQEKSKNMHIADAPLLFVIDEKNRSVELVDKGLEFLSNLTLDPDFFNMPDITSAMMEIDHNTALSEDEKATATESLAQDFSVKSKRLHSMHQLLKAYTLFEKDTDYVVMDDEVKIVDEQTGRMMEGRRYSDGLHQALEAKESVKIGDVTQTYATVTLQNYFRMYHKLTGMTGTAETEAREMWEIYKLDVVIIPTNKPIIRDDRQDLVYKTEKEKYNAVIEEISKLVKARRPVLVGTTSVDISETLSRILNLRGISHNVLNAKQHQREAEIVAEAGLPGKVTIATNMAGRGTDIKISDEVKKAGGLAIIGTERHESRRVDRQLRGRAGRQGDPGSSQFFVSLEDKLMRLFQSERIAGMMDKMGHKEGDVIQHSMVTKSIERAQKKVEENNYGIRKRLLEYDDVMNIQREAIYKKRKNALWGSRLSVDIYNMIVSLAENVVQYAKQNNDYNAFKMDALSMFGLTLNITQEEFENSSTDSLIQQFESEILETYHLKKDRLKKILLPFIKDVKMKEGDRYKRVQVPYTDGSSKDLAMAVDIDDAIETNGDSIPLDIEKIATLALIDDNWKEHLRSVDELKDSSQTASFEQKDPLVIYKMEAYNLFESLIHKVNHSVISYLMKGHLEGFDEHNIREAKQQTSALQNVTESHPSMTDGQQSAKQAASNVGQRKVQETVKHTGPVIGRNDPCPCGSGKKYKKCHGRNA